MAGVSKGAYVLEDAARIAKVVLIGTGSEVWPCVDAAKLLAAEGIAARVVSFPSWKIFEEQTAEYKASVLPAGVPKLAVEAGATLGWWKYVGLDGDVVGLDRFGASAPGPDRAGELGFSAENVAARAKKLVKYESASQWRELWSVVSDPFAVRVRKVEQLEANELVPKGSYCEVRHQFRSCGVSSEGRGPRLSGQGRARGGGPGRITSRSRQDDYPDFAEKVGLAIKQGDAPRGILICGSGVGVCVAATRFPEFAPACATIPIPRTRAWSTTT